MNNQDILQKTEESLSSLETQNLIAFFQQTTLTSIFENPLVLVALLLVFFYAVIMRSKFMLLFLFSLLSLLLLIRYTFPSPERMLDPNSLLPFVCGCMGIGAVILYFTFVKAE